MNVISPNMERGDMTYRNWYEIRDPSRMLEKIKSTIITDLAYLLLRERISDDLAYLGES